MKRKGRANKLKGLGSEIWKPADGRPTPTVGGGGLVMEGAQLDKITKGRKAPSHGVCGKGVLRLPNGIKGGERVGGTNAQNKWGGFLFTRKSMRDQGRARSCWCPQRNQLCGNEWMADIKERGVLERIGRGGEGQGTQGGCVYR